MLKLAGRFTATAVAAVLFLGAGIGEAKSNSVLAQARGKFKIAAPQEWAEAELDLDGDVRVVVLQREGAVSERAAERLQRRLLGRIGRSFNRIGGDVIKVPPGRLAEVLADLEADPDVAVAAPDRKDQRAQGQIVPWGVSLIHADPASRAALDLGSGAGVKVAVLDTGIWQSAASGTLHPDLAAAYRGGYDFVNDDPYPWDDNGHGTHVAGILAAGYNSIGVVGAAPGVRLYALKVLDARGGGYYSDLIAALDWCIEHGIRVVNYSGGSEFPEPLLESACTMARAAGITIVAAAGNAGREGLLYPAAYPSVIAVGSTDKSDAKSTLSNTGEELDLVAPGESIRSTYLGGGYARLSGTSMAVPHVAGAAALLAGRDVSDPRLLQEYLQTTARELGEPGHDPQYGHGRVDAASTLPAMTSIVAPLPGETVPSGTPYSVSWTPAPGAAAYRVLFAPGGSKPWTEVAVSTADNRVEWDPPIVGGALTTGRMQVAAYGADGALLSVETRAGFAVRSLWLTAPTAGASFPGGEPLQLSWELSETPRPVHGIAVDLSKDGGKTWKRLRRFSDASVRTYEWAAPGVSTARRMRLRVSLLDVDGAAISRAAVAFDLVPAAL